MKALKEEEERRAEIEEDEMLYTYARDDSYSQVKKKQKKSSGRKSEPVPSKSNPKRNKSINRASVDGKSLKNIPNNSPENKRKSSIALQKQSSASVSPTSIVRSKTVSSEVQSSHQVKSPETRARAKVKSPEIGLICGPKSPETRSQSRVKSPDSIPKAKKTSDVSKRKSVPTPKSIAKAEDSETTPKPKGRGRPPKVKNNPVKIEPPQSNPGPILNVPTIASPVNQQNKPVPVTLKTPEVPVVSSVAISTRPNIIPVPSPSTSLAGVRVSDNPVRQKVGVTMRQPTSVTITPPTSQVLIRQSGVPVQQLSGISLNQAGVFLRPQTATSIIPQSGMVVRQPAGIPVIQQIGMPVQQQNMPSGLVLVHLVGGKQVIVGSPVQMTGQKQGIVTLGQRSPIPVSITNKVIPASQVISSTITNSGLISNQNSNRIPIGQIVNSGAARQVASRISMNQVTNRVVYNPISKQLIATPSPEKVIAQPMSIVNTTPLSTKIVSQSAPCTSILSNDTTNCTQARMPNPAAVKKVNHIVPVDNTNMPQPWSNANLVIRTRRASLQEKVPSGVPPDQSQHPTVIQNSISVVNQPNGNTNAITLQNIPTIVKDIKDAG